MKISCLRATNKGEQNVNFNSFRSALTGVFLALAGSLLLGGCGGGGAAASNPQEGGSTVNILPQGISTAYAGVPFTIQVVGGRPPYSLSSSEPGVFPLPATLNGHSVTVIPANPGVVDPGTPGELPVRSVTIFARDNLGTTAQPVLIKVGQNFLTAYGLSLIRSNCPTGAETGLTSPSACTGGTTLAQLQAVFGGNLHGDQQFRLEVIRGNYSLRNPVTGQASNIITVTSDHTGTVIGLIEVPAGVPAQIAVIRVVHIPTGVYADQAFLIGGAALQPTEPLTPVPNAFTFTGATSAECGTGFGDFYVFGGIPPFSAVSANNSIIVTPPQTSDNPGRFTVGASNPTICVSNGTVIVTDSLGRRATVTVTTEPGSAAPPEPVPITVSPKTITLTCGTSGSVTVVGGSGPLSVASSHPRVTAIISGTTITVTRPVGDGATVYPTAATISVTDGSQVATLDATVPANCP
jgi:hypothetical protein